LAFPEETALFRKSLLTLTGVIRDVWPDASIDKVLVASGSRQLIGESWLRALAPLESRVFGTHLSSEDLLRIISTLAWMPARYLVSTCRDALGSTGPRILSTLSRRRYDIGSVPLETRRSSTAR
jgi:hypothetical protein